LKRFPLGILFVVVVIGVVQAATLFGAIKSIYLPPPGAVAVVLVTSVRSGEIWLPLVSTLTHVAVGWVGACVIGVMLGAAIGRSSVLRALFGPILDFMRPLPASALVPAAILIFGVNQQTIYIIAVFGSVWPILLSAVKGFESVDVRLIESARLLRLGPLATFRSILLPSALTDVIAGARVSLAIALIVTVVAEMLTSQIGLGYGIILAARSYNTSDLYAGVVLLGLLGFFTNAGMEHFDKTWRARIRGKLD